MKKFVSSCIAFGENALSGTKVIVALFKGLQAFVNHLKNEKDEKD